MVIIDNLFIHFKRPRQFVFDGEKYLDVYKMVDKSFQKTRTVEDISIFDIGAGEGEGESEGNGEGSGEDVGNGFRDVVRELTAHGDGDTGLILNANPFIYNIFDFDRIPIRDETQREIVEWRLRKVFPENIEEYDHRFFKLSRTRVLSVLLKKTLKQKIEELFSANNIRLTYMGNSTVNYMNNVANLKKSPDFLVEVDRNQFIVIFQSGSQPFYIRKFRGRNESDAAAEIVKTINYVKNSYAQVPHTYSVLSNRSELDFDLIRYELMQQEVRPLELKKKELLFLPG